MDFSSPGDPSAHFSPSVSRMAASAAKDWSYVDSWLASKFPSGQVPPFERNPATLQALMATAAVSESVDETSDMLAGLNAASSSQRTSSVNDDETVGQPDARSTLRTEILLRVADHLSQEGRAALEALALTAAQQGIGCPDTDSLVRNFLAMQSSLFETEQMLARVGAVRALLSREASGVAETLAASQDARHLVPSESELPRENLELQRKTRVAAKQLVDGKDDLAVAPSIRLPHPTIRCVLDDEEELLALLKEKKRLDAQMAVFAGLSSDPDRAKSQVEDSEQLLLALRTTRDEMFESLVEKASPVKRS
ncbi:uncharacterized protein UV8b_03063 [Ustilaginoidea virens]|uniref:HAUS augmin-like complex subunit 1 n=1 Tax=Ustilaginoidea virens TaxID=1159556 RepID=A0A063C1J2_USTVR|nr:uncharacterized protein UV8b_03063 [Ustilaginoidea virens]QUC18822.1 hypothetical protein UV8b_03063 [Ustilaginoidea virens]GAO15811.1 hypothetical protein UVI_02021250 [Ustilaginoidea virens]